MQTNYKESERKCEETKSRYWENKITDDTAIKVRVKKVGRSDNGEAIQYDSIC